MISKQGKSSVEKIVSYIFFAYIRAIDKIWNTRIPIRIRDYCPCRVGPSTNACNVFSE